MLQVTGLRRARSQWPQHMREVDQNRSDGEDPRTLRHMARDFSEGFYPQPWWFNALYHRHGDTWGPDSWHGDPLDRAGYNDMLNLMAVTRVRMIWNRFIINLRRLIGRRKHRAHSASLLGAW